MSSAFGAYAKYYDLLYQDKDYVAEANYVVHLLGTHGTNISRVLELGAGTGRHGSILAGCGLHVVGVEASEEMIRLARERASSVHGEGSFRVVAGDARSVECNAEFDAVISLFHVVSYQVTNRDAHSVFETAAKHLQRGGLFLFDVWYGPAVLSMLPSVRVKRMSDGAFDVLRIAEPLVDLNENRVEVSYTIIVSDKHTSSVETLVEQHQMRYYFGPELHLLANCHGMEIIHSEEWMTGECPSEDTWGVTFIAQKRI